MAKYDKIQVITTMKETGMVPVFYHSDPETAKKVLKACYDGGVRAFEFTNRGDFAHEVFGELVKYALIASRPLFDELLHIDKLSAECLRPEWIDTCVEYKNKIVAIDPDDVKERHVLNFGHTYGHAIESLCAAQGEPIPHGIAVAIGILFECQKAVQEGNFPMEDFLLVKKLIRQHFEVPTYNEALEEQLHPYLLQDKKNKNGEVAFVQLSEIGKARL